MLIASAQLITITVPRTPNSKDPNSVSPPEFKLKGGCGPIGPDVNVSDIFRIYSQQLYNILEDSNNKLLLVKHETQVVQGVNHRMIFRVMDVQTHDKIYYGFQFFVDLEGGVRITGYLESFDLQNIIKAFGFVDRKLWNYKCVDLNKDSVNSFKAWGKELNVCPLPVIVDSANNKPDELVEFESVLPTSQAGTNYSAGQHRPQYIMPSIPIPSGQQGYNHHEPSNKYIPSYTHVENVVHEMMLPTQSTQSNTMPDVGAEDSPFNTFKFNIITKGSDGKMIKIGSTAPGKRSLGSISAIKKIQGNGTL